MIGFEGVQDLFPHSKFIPVLVIFGHMLLAYWIKDKCRHELTQFRTILNVVHSQINHSNKNPYYPQWTYSQINLIFNALHMHTFLGNSNRFC